MQLHSSGRFSRALLTCTSKVGWRIELRAKDKVAGAKPQLDGKVQGLYPSLNGAFKRVWMVSGRSFSRRVRVKS